jgi:hypothetical protein
VTRKKISAIVKFLPDAVVISGAEWGSPGKLTNKQGNNL